MTELPPRLKHSPEGTEKVPSVLPVQPAPANRVIEASLTAEVQARMAEAMKASLNCMLENFAKKKVGEWP